jgi:hypothetical protein
MVFSPYRMIPAAAGLTAGRAVGGIDDALGVLAGFIVILQRGSSFIKRLID